MVEAESDIRIHGLRVQRERGGSGSWIKDPGLALACVWLAALLSCDAVKSEQNTREFVDELVSEMCAPGAFYRECWWVSIGGCHSEMPTLVVNALPTFAERLQPSEALRQHVFERVFFFHYVYVSPVLDPAFEKEACMDETRWKHVPPSKVGDMARLRATEEKWRRERSNAPSAPATTATAPTPAPGTPPEPSSPEPTSSPVPDPVPAP